MYRGSIKFDGPEPSGETPEQREHRLAKARAWKAMHKESLKAYMLDYRKRRKAAAIDER